MSFYFVVLQGKTLKSMKPDTFHNIKIMALCGLTKSKKPDFPKRIKIAGTRIPLDCKCRLKKKRTYYIVIKNYRKSKPNNNGAYELNMTSDLIMDYSETNKAKILRLSEEKALLNFTFFKN